MTSVIPPLDEELEHILSRIVKEKYLAEEDVWKNKAQPKILRRINAIYESAKKLARYDSKRTSWDLHKDIKELNDKIETHLNEVFKDQPPFTLLRLAELLLDSKKEGYDLVNNREIIKYFNSIFKLVDLYTSLYEYPRIRIIHEPISDHKQRNESSPSDINVSLIEIPWLKSTGRSQSTDSREDKSHIPSSPPVGEDSKDLNDEEIRNENRSRYLDEVQGNERKRIKNIDTSKQIS